MSAYVVEDSTARKVVTAILSDEHYRNRLNPIVNIDLENLKNAEAFLNILHALNVEAVNQRYGENAKPRKLKYIPETAESKIAALKSLRCYLYQCSEGDVPETELFKALTTIAGEMAEDIVYNLPEYRDAAWG